MALFKQKKSSDRCTYSKDHIVLACNRLMTDVSKPLCLVVRACVLYDVSESHL